MSTNNQIEDAVDVLQQLGLKEYEARCFVGLSRLETGTAKTLSEMTEVPRTRVYDAVRVLEAQGLVEVQHSSPQQFRAVSLREATETLRDQYEARVERFEDALEPIEREEQDDDKVIQEVWSMSGREAIENRAGQLLDDATDEIVFVLGSEQLLTTGLVETLVGVDDDVNLIVGALTEPLEERIHSEVPSATTFISGLDWLHGDANGENETAIGRLLLIDRSTILMSTVMPETGKEQAVFGGGFGNGLIVIARRIMAQGLLQMDDPAP